MRPAVDTKRKDFSMGQVQGRRLTQTAPVKSSSWWRVLLIGLFFYIATLVALVLTGNPILFPTVVMVGSFMIPVTYVAFFYDHRHLSRLTVPAIARAFIYGGLFGVIAASVLEPLFIRRLDFATAFSVGLIEEFVKILGILVLARHMSHDAEMDGLLLGVAAGMGFAALESNGYAFTAFLRSEGKSLHNGLRDPASRATIPDRSWHMDSDPDKRPVSREQSRAFSAQLQSNWGLLNYLNLTRLMGRTSRRDYNPLWARS